MKTLSDIPARARDLHLAGAEPTREWTLPLMCDHLARAMKGSTGILGPSPAAKPIPFLQKMAGRIVVQWVGFIPHGRTSPERVLPQADITWEQAIANLDDAVRICQQKMLTHEPWMVHPLLGFSDARGWQRFHLVHARHHFNCLRGRARK